MALLSIQINNYKRYDKLGYSSICYNGSKIGWVSMKEISSIVTPPANTGSNSKSKNAVIKTDQTYKL